MQERLKEHKDKLRKKLRAALLNNLDAQYAEMLIFINTYEEACNGLINILKNEDNPGESSGFLSKHIEHRKILLETLGTLINNREGLSADHLFGGFDKELKDIYESTPRVWRCIQSNDRFCKLTDDKPVAIAIKTIKKNTLAVHSLLHRLRNVVFSWLGKTKKDKPRWSQTIPILKLTRHYFENTLLADFSHVTDGAMKNIALFAHDIWKADDELFSKYMAIAKGQADKNDILDHYATRFLPGITSIRSKVESEKKGLRPLLDRVWKEIDEEFTHKVHIAGTLEQPAILYPDFYLDFKRNNCRKLFTQRVKRRHNTLFALADDWKFNQEIYILTTNALRIKLLLKEKFQERTDTILGVMREVNNFLVKTRDEITPGTMPATYKKLQHLKFAAGKDLHNIIIPNVKQMMQSQGFPELITETKNELIKILSSKTRKRILIKGFDPSQPYRDKSLQAISLLELLEFDIAGNLEKAIYQTRLRSLKELDDFRNRLHDLGRIVLFNLESAMMMADKQKESSPGDVADEARSGLQRAIERYNELLNAFRQFSESIQNDFDTIISHFNARLIELTDNKNVEKIRYRIIQTRAIKKRQHFFNIIRQRVSFAFQKIIKQYRILQQNTVSRIRSIRSKLGIQEHSKDITIEVTDFLAKDQDRKQKLPFVYRRLFVNEPLTDSAFYHPRTETKKMLHNAYNKWREGSFTATLIYGEKGSGISTFMHMYFKEHFENSISTYQLIPQKRVQTENELLAIMGESLQKKPFKTYNDFEKFVENNAPFVFFLDKLHLFYLRQPSGFQLLKRLFEIISHTSKQIFWICSCGLYAASFLDKSIGLFGYFPQLIKMKSLETDKVRNIIMLRHNASGYKLHFSPSAGDLAVKNFIKKPGEEQQAILKEKFFEKINRLSQSNISFALQLWIHSSNKVEDNTVYLDSLDMLDLSFVYNLPDEVVFGLHALVLHEILDSQMLCEIMNTDKDHAYMMLMRLKDRGIVLQNNGMFAIHPLLYRQSLALLLDKNLIY